MISFGARCSNYVSRILYGNNNTKIFQMILSTNILWPPMAVGTALMKRLGLLDGTQNTAQIIL